MRKGIRFSTLGVSLTLIAVGLSLGGAANSGAASHQTMTSNATKSTAPTVHAQYTLNPKAVLISARDVKFQTSDHTVAQKLTYVGTTPIVVGSIIVVATTTGPFYGTVTAVLGQNVSTVPATLGDIFESLNLTMTSPTGSASTATGTGTGTGTAASRGLRNAATTSQGSPPVRPAPIPLLSATCSGSISPTVNVNATANAGTFSLQASFSWAGGLKSASITDNPSFSITASTAVAGTGSCLLKQQVFDVTLTPIEFFIGWVPVWITQHISGEADLNITADGSASINLGYNASALLGVAKPHGGSWGVVRSGSVTKTVNTTLNINTTTTFDLPVTYAAALYGFGGLSITADPFATLAVNVSPPVCKPLPWLDLSAGLNGSVDAFIDFGSLYSWSHNFGTWNFFTTDLINHQTVCPPITTHLNISTVANAIQTSFTPSLPSGNVIPLHSTVILQDLAGTTARYFIAISNPNNSGNAFSVKWYQPQNYVLTHSGVYVIKIEGGVITNGHGSIVKQVTINVP